MSVRKKTEQPHKPTTNHPSVCPQVGTLEEDKWTRLFNSSKSNILQPLIAQDHIKRWNSYSKPILVACDDNEMYVAKGKHAGRAIVNELIVGLVGGIMSMPVSKVCIVNVPEELINGSKGLKKGKYEPGLYHGSLWLNKDAFDLFGLCNTKSIENRARFSDLAILYGLFYSGDEQFIYTNKNSPIVHSVDHGHFIFGGPSWTEDSLKRAPRAEPYRRIVRDCALTPMEMQNSLSKLRLLNDQKIAESVMAPPGEWGISDSERLSLAIYMAKRRDEMLG